MVVFEKTHAVSPSNSQSFQPRLGINYDNIVLAGDGPFSFKTLDRCFGVIFCEMSTWICSLWEFVRLLVHVCHDPLGNKDVPLSRF